MVPYAIHDTRRFGAAAAPRSTNLSAAQEKILGGLPDRYDLPNVLKYSGDDMLVIGTDYGHNDTSSEILALRKLKEDGTIPTRW